MYKIVYDKYSLENNSVIKIENNSVIPFDPANTDYQAYLKWLEDPNNKPLPADE